MEADTTAGGQVLGQVDSRIPPALTKEDKVDNGGEKLKDG